MKASLLLKTAAVTPILVALGLLACGSSDAGGGGSCERLLECCEALHPALAATCQDTYDRYHEADGAETECTRAYDLLEQQGQCASGSGTPGNDAGPVGANNPGDGATASPENSNALCSDGTDNDGDGFLDCVDYSCRKNPAVTVCGPPLLENTNALCSDGRDNDDDGYVDCIDYSCSKNPAVTVCH